MAEVANPKIRYAKIKRPIIKKKKRTSMDAPDAKKKVGAMILCDGSYLEDKMCGGIAGVLSIIEPGKPPVEIEFDAMSFGARTSVVVELYAISAGVKALKDYMAEHNVDVSEIQVYSDSKWGMVGYERMKNGESYYPAYTPGLRMLDNSLAPLKDAKLSFTHVKAHQDDSIANYIERRHNQVDVRASKRAHEALGYLKAPSKNKAYAAMLPANIESEEKCVELHNLGYAMAKEGLLARALFDGTTEKVTSHPFIDGIKAACIEDNRPLGELLKDVTEYTPLTYGQANYRVKNTSMEDFVYRAIASGIETVKLKKLQADARRQGKPTDERRIVEPYRIQPNNDNAGYAGEAVRLLHGRSKMQGYQKINQPPFMTLSRFVIDMTQTVSSSPRDSENNPSTRGDWIRKVKAFHENARVPVFSSPTPAYAQERTAKNRLFPCDESVLKASIIDVLDDYMSVMSPNQVEMKISEALKSYGLVANPENIRSAVNKNASVESVAERMLLSCVPSVKVGVPIMQVPNSTVNMDNVPSVDNTDEADLDIGHKRKR
jgi:hypothetical protein